VQELNRDLQQKFKNTAEAMRARLEQKPSSTVLKKMIQEKAIGSFNKCHKLSPQNLSDIAEKGGIIGVDGSTNSAGGPFPYMITLQQAMAKACDKSQNDIIMTDALSPLIMENPVSEEEYRKLVKGNLAVLEVEVALEALEQSSPMVILLDGSLVRFKIEASSSWEKLKTMALDQSIILAGIVEGISTGIISDCLKNLLPEKFSPASDWEVLFGLLEVGEILEVAPGLFKEGFRTCFMRASVDPKPIGIDLLEEQQGYLKEVVDLVYTLTPSDGRGIPLWLDIIDENVRISDEVMKGLLNKYLGEEYVEFLMPKREKRQI
jgi:hypothetical protein